MPVPTVVYLYGPPAVGKLTVATELHAHTGFRLFHNHLTVDPIKAVFDFASSPFTEVIHRLRLDVFETAARHGVDLIFTNNSVWGIPDGRRLFVEFAAETRRRVESAGGRVAFARLTAPVAALEERVAADSRRQRQKLVDPTRLRTLLQGYDPASLSADDLVVDTGSLSPREAAVAIARHFDLPERPGPPS
jgi:hypothetical protein